MKKGLTDRRRIRMGHDPEAEALFRREMGRMRESELGVARALARIHRQRVFVRAGCASAVEWAAREGMDGVRAGELLRMGLTLQALPRTEDEVRSGRVTPQAAGAIGRLFTAPGLRSSEDAEGAADALLDKARTAAPSDLRREVREQVERDAQRDRVVPLSLFVTESVRERFRRAKTLAEKKAQNTLTDGQALGALTDDYLARHDPLLTKRRERRVGPTAELPGDRSAPGASVVRERASHFACGPPAATVEWRHAIEDRRRRVVAYGVPALDLAAEP